MMLSSSFSMSWMKFSICIRCFHHAFKTKVEEGEGKEEEEQGQKRNINKKVVKQEGEEDKKNKKREKEESTSKRTGNEIMV